MDDYRIENRQIIVGDSYGGKNILNEYFGKHKLKKDNYTSDQILALIDDVAFMLDDYSRVDEMLD